MSKAARGLRYLSVVVIVGLLGACSSSSSPTTAKQSSTTTQAATTTLALTPAGKTWGVGRTDVSFVDTSRPTAANTKAKIAAKSSRTLPTVILYPTTTTSDDATSDNHPMATGRFPLLVFSHGVTASGPAYVPILKKVAAAGFVVALPTYPLTSGGTGWANLTDVVNQPADVSFLIGKLLEESDAATGLLAGHLDPNAVAIGGHSLGAITSLFFTNSCCADKRVQAIVAVSGMLFDAKDKSDTYDNPPTDLPLLLLHGKKDTTVPYAPGSQHIFETFTKVPRAFVTFPNATHTDLLGSASFMPAVIAFLNMELRHDDTQWNKLSSTLATNKDATLQVGGGMPQPSS